MQSSSSSGDVPWGDLECAQLLDNVLAECDKTKSSRSYKVDIPALRWKNLAVPGHTAEDCKDKFLFLLKQVRKHRVLREIVVDAKDALSNPKEKKRNHPDLPSRPKHPYNIFLAKYAKKYRSQGMTFTSLSKELANKWRGMSDKKKAKYVIKSERQKDEYHLKLEEFLERHPDVVLKKPEPPTPCEVYITANLGKYRQKHPDVNYKEMRLGLQGKYQKLSDKKKLKFIRKAEGKLDLYVRQCQAYKASHPDTSLKPAKVVLTKQERLILEQADGKPVHVPPRNLFLYYCSTVGSMTDLKLSERIKQQSIRYHHLDADQLAQLTKDYEKAVHTYAAQYREFYDSLEQDRKEQEKSPTEALAPFQRILNPDEKKRKKTTAGSKWKKSASDSDSLSEDEEVAEKAEAPSKSSSGKRQMDCSGDMTSTKATQKKRQRKQSSSESSSDEEDEINPTVSSKGTVSPEKRGQKKSVSFLPCKVEDGINGEDLSDFEAPPERKKSKKKLNSESSNQEEENAANLTDEDASPKRKNRKVSKDSRTRGTTSRKKAVLSGNLGEDNELDEPATGKKVSRQQKLKESAKASSGPPSKKSKKTKEQDLDNLLSSWSPAF